MYNSRVFHIRNLALSSVPNLHVRNSSSAREFLFIFDLKPVEIRTLLKQMNWIEEQKSWFACDATGPSDSRFVDRSTFSMMSLLHKIISMDLINRSEWCTISICTFYQKRFRTYPTIFTTRWSIRLLIICGNWSIIQFVIVFKSNSKFPSVKSRYLFMQILHVCDNSQTQSTIQRKSPTLMIGNCVLMPVCDYL